MPEVNPIQTFLEKNKFIFYAIHFGFRESYRNRKNAYLTGNFMFLKNDNNYFCAEREPKRYIDQNVILTYFEHKLLVYLPTIQRNVKMSK